VETPRTFEALVALMDRLREPGGCPWDREQTYSTLRGYLLEECYEVVEALDRGDGAELCEELGDLLFQIVFLSRLGAEEGKFTAADVVRGIADKIVRRHPHVFAEERADTTDEVLRKWEEIKRKEKEAAGIAREDSSALAGVPRALPALQKAQRLGTKAARVGFDWRSIDGVLEKVEEEIGELREALARRDGDATREELGDLLFALVMLGRHAGVDAEEALERTNRKFVERFGAVERSLRERGIAVAEAGPALLDELWNEAKGS
jgi:tetrapyrrole methylase family protein/MazG family protein/ATP diphosphatase